MSGGIIIQRNAAVLTALKDPSLYDSLGLEKHQVDEISAKDPASRTLGDLYTLTAILYDLVRAT